MTMRVLECNACGETLSAANDDELERRLNRHMKDAHPSMSYDEGSTHETISHEAYTASDS